MCRHYRGDRNYTIGATGTAWNVTILPVASAGGGTSSQLLKNIEYATLHHPAIISNSYTLALQNNAFLDACNSFPGLMVWSSASNYWDLDFVDSVLQHFRFPNAIAVMGSKNRDTRDTYPDYGRNSVHLAAPGENILTLVPETWNGSPEIPYLYRSGTSFAAPQVSGVAALILATHPGANPIQKKSSLMRSVDINPAFKEVSITGGRLNASAAVRREFPAYDAIGRGNISTLR